MGDRQPIKRAAMRALMAWVAATWVGLVWADAAARAEQAPQHLFIYHIDVGQGDATLVVSPAGRTLLVDGGNRGQGTRAVRPLLDALGITKLDYLLVTHHDADHLGGVDEVVFGLRGVSVAAYDRVARQRDKELTDRGNLTQYGEYVRSLLQLDPQVELVPIAPGECGAAGGKLIDLGDEVVVLVVAANGAVLGQPDPVELGRDKENERSVALKISYRRFDYFIGGDLTGGGFSGTRRTADLESLAAPRIGNVDVLRINHHGSATSSNSAFLTTLDPAVAVISVGDGGVNLRYRHPHRDVLDRLHELRRNARLAAVFQTRRGETVGGLSERDLDLVRIADGDIVLFTDGLRYTINGLTLPADGGPRAQTGCAQQ